MKSHVSLLSHTPMPEMLAEISAALCTSGKSINGAIMNASDGLLRNILASGHESVIEHVSFTFGIEGVSRSFLAQITRHRLASFSVQSQRYVEQDEFDYITPPKIEKDSYLRGLFDATMNQMNENYKELSSYLNEWYIHQGMDKKEARTKALEDARFVLPNACETKMIVTMNARELRHFFRLRCCKRAQWEIRGVALEMLELVKEVAPILFEDAGAPCVCGKCPEGKLSCGQPYSKIESAKEE